MTANLAKTARAATTNARRYTAAHVRPPGVAYATVPRLWPGSTIVCLGSGPSLTQDDVDRCRAAGARTIAINDAYKLALWADVLYACDNKWWGWAAQNYQGKHPTFPQFTGLRFSLKPWPGVSLLRSRQRHGLERDPAYLAEGLTSGYQAINLAVHLGAARILLLGYDMRTPGKGRDHFFGRHPDHTMPPFNAALKDFPTLVEPLHDVGVTVLNCTPGSAIRCFPQVLLDQVWP